MFTKSSFKEFIATTCAFLGVPCLMSFGIALTMTLDHQDGGRWLWASIIIFAIAYIGQRWADEL